MARKKKQKKQKPTDPAAMNRRQQIAATYRMTRENDPQLTLWMIGSFLVSALLGFLLFFLLGGAGGTVALVLAIIGALMFGLLGAMIVFSRRAQRAAYARMEGQLGAAASALTMLRRGWKTDPMVAFTRQQDVVHRVVGPPGIVLVGEGNPNRVRQLLADERRKHERVVADTPVHEVQCGNHEGQVPLPQLLKAVRKKGRGVKPAQMTDVLNRLKALDARRSNMPIPKGPVPTSMKGMRGNMRGR